MKSKKLIWLCVPFLLAGCTQNGGSSDSSSSVSYSSVEGLYTRLTRAIEKLGTSSFRCDGTFGYYYGDSSGNTYADYDYNVEIEVSNDAYYYVEKDQTTDEVLYVQNYFKDTSDKIGVRSLNYNTNEVVETVDKFAKKYDEVMENEIKNLAVKKLKGIKGQDGWYNVSDLDIAASFCTFLTGYQTYSSAYDVEGGLSVSQLALHFDGDVFDSMSMLLEYTDDEIESSVIYEQYQFTLDITGYGETTPQKLTAYPEDSTTADLKAAFAAIEDVDNYTMHFDVKFDSKKLEDTSYDYYCDFKNSLLYTTKVKRGAKSVKKTDEDGEEYTDYEYFNYNIGVKNKANEKGKSVPTIFWFDSTSHETMLEQSFDKYFGTTSSSYTVDMVMPSIGVVGAGCFKPLGNDKFSTYPLRVSSSYTLRTLALYSLLPYFEWSSTTSSSLVVEVASDKSLKITIDQSVSTQTSDTTYETVDATTTVTINNIGTTTIPDLLINA